MSPQPNRVGLSIVRNEGGRSDLSWSQKVGRCAACAQRTEYAKDGSRQVCGVGLSTEISESHHLGYEPNPIATCHEVYLLNPAVRTVDERRHPRIPCRNVHACIKTEANPGVVVDVINVSRGGVCFSSYAEFYAGTVVSIATHYLKDGQNIFQNGRIVRMQRSPSTTAPGEYAAEFSPDRGMGVPIPEAHADKHPEMLMLLVGPSASRCVPAR